jgi:hypothetical protein
MSLRNHQKSGFAVSRLTCAGQTIIWTRCSTCSASSTRTRTCPPGSRCLRSLPAGPPHRAAAWLGVALIATAAVISALLSTFDGPTSLPEAPPRLAGFSGKREDGTSETQ